ncbi:hypothetical protein [Rhodococcus sp. SBT000017]|uniref:hypothetical protein n=1 Tax=Rhodococcus sp. SBT000017 TaxID=1803385 RepID=UPI0011C37D0F|nr:hypothetical protein [Rhodococcus sp. SBT000017]
MAAAFVQHTQSPFQLSRNHRKEGVFTMPKKHSRKAQPLKRGRDRQIRIRGQLRPDPDLRRMARTMVAIAIAQAEKEAQEETEHRAERQEAGDE